MLVNLTDILGPAKQKGYAVGFFNAVNLELARGIISAAEKQRSPIIIGTAEVLLPYGPLVDVTPMLLDIAKRATVPVAVHFDHGLSVESCEQALRLGFSSVMIDASSFSFEENIRQTKEVVALAHALGATVEAELGRVGNNEDSLEGEVAQDKEDPKNWYTDPKQAQEFVQQTKVDALAVAVGTQHGTYKVKPVLDLERITEISSSINVPLVLHGGSGLSEEMFKESIRRGISKINIFTDINMAAARAYKKALSEGVDNLTELIPLGVAAVQDVVENKLSIFASPNRVP